MASESCARGQGSGGAGAGALDTLTNPNLAHLPAADLVVRLHRDDRSGSDFADVALVLAVRERRLSEAEDRVRAADAVAAGLRDTIRKLELRAANAEALARRNSLGSESGSGGIISGGERAVALEDDHHQSQAGLELQIGAAELTGGEIRAGALTASETVVVPELPAGEIENGEITAGVCFGAGVKATATPAEVGDNMPRPSPLRRIGAAAVPAVSRSMPDELIEERAVERVVVDTAVRRNHEVAQAGVVDARDDEVSEAVTGKRKKEQAAAAFASDEKKEEPLKKKPKQQRPPAGALDSDSDSDKEVEEEEELHFTEAQGWEMLYHLKDQVAAWESVYDAAQGTLQAAAAATPPVATTVHRLQNKVILCERMLQESMAGAAKAEDRLRAEIAECKHKATMTEAGLREEIVLARRSAVTQLEVWKHRATEAQAQIRAASTYMARLLEEIEAWKTKAFEAQTCLRSRDKIIARLQDKVVHGECKLAKAASRIRVSSDELAANRHGKSEASKQGSAIELEAQVRRATMIEEHLRAKIRTLELKVANLKAACGSDIGRSDDRTVAIDLQKSHMVPENNNVHRVVPAAGATKKAQRQKGVSFFSDKVFKSYMGEKKLIGNEENEESLKKQAAVVTASKELYPRSWSQAPYLQKLGSQSVEKDSGEEA